MLTCNLMGGLGNQLFQIFTTIAYSMRSKQKFIFLDQESLGGGGSTLRYTFWNSLLSNLKPFLIKSLPQNFPIIREQGFQYKDLPIEQLQNQDFMLYGYFQSYKYFEYYYTTIHRLLGISKKKEAIFSKYMLSDERAYLSNTISIHFRLGDYKKVSDYHPIMSKDYYLRALQFICNQNNTINYNVLYFCEEEDIDSVTITINFLKDNFPNMIFKRCENTFEDWEQMLLMSCCTHNIIANSSFSWWGAYFNSNKDKIVCYPSVWFGQKANHNTVNLFPPDWVRIQA